MPCVGVDYYKKGTATVPVYFPEGKVDCRHCPYLRNVEHLGLHRCAFTDVLVDKIDLDDRHIT